MDIFDLITLYLSLLNLVILIHSRFKNVQHRQNSILIKETGKWMKGTQRILKVHPRYKHIQIAPGLGGLDAGPPAKQGKGGTMTNTTFFFHHLPSFSCSRRKFRSQTSDNMDRWKAEQGRGREKRKIRREKIWRERVRRKKMQMREKVGKSRNTVFFQWFVAPEGRKVGSLKRRVRTQLATGTMKNCTPLWREAHFQVKMYKTPQVRTTFGSYDVEKAHAVVARSTFPSQNVTKHLRSGPLLEVEMSKKCTPLWREAHFQVKMYKTPQLRTTFGSCDVEKVHAVVARSTFPSQNVENTSAPDHFWKLRCWKSARRCGAKHIFQVKMHKTHHSRTTFGGSDCRKSVEKVHAVVARSTFRSQKCKKLRVLSLFWREDVEQSRHWLT